MASKRNLKININYITGELMSECFTYQQFHPELGDDKLAEILQGIINLRNDAIARINHIDGNKDMKRVKEQFRSIKDNFKKSVELLDQLPSK